MPIQIKAPDGSIAQFPDGMPDADIEKVMAQHYPQPSMLDRAIASPPGRLLHDFGVNTLRGITTLAAGTQDPALASFRGDPIGPSERMQSVSGAADRVIEQPYQGALARNQNTPGYAAARSQADAVQAQRGSGFQDQMLAPFTPAMAGIAGLPGGFDAMNANADAQTVAQDAYAKDNPGKSFGAGLLGGFLAGPEGAAKALPSYAGDAALLTKAVKGQVMGPLPLRPQGVPVLKPGAQEALDAGYTLAPRMIADKPGVAADAMAGWSGKVKTAQAASAKNQEVTNSLAAKSIGLKPDAVLTDDIFKTVRKTYGQAYEAIPKTLPVMSVDKEFLDGISTLGGADSAAAAEFPDIMRNTDVEKLVSGLSGKDQFPTSAGMALVKKLRSDAKTNFRAADPSKLELAFAQRDAANEVDNLIERNLAATGNEQLVQNYRHARQVIARSHDLEAATNTATGNVSARKLAALAARGKPLSGDMKTIADAASAFPKAFQSESAFGEVEPLSVLDMGAAAISMAHGNPGLAGALLGKPLARSAVLSRPMQNRIVNSATSLPRPPLELPRLKPSSALVPLLLSNRQ